ncbi:MAG: hypothetical protein NT062_07695 [Proteobacteria bacterium]|nr:hypothetical protein [Pseudomonadota bacterium]
MLRIALLASLSIGCAGGPLLQLPSLPELVATQPPTSPIVVHELGLVPGERIIWDLQAKGFSIARAELVVGDDRVTSHVETNALASAVSSLTHDLTTVIDPETALPRTASETLVVDGETSRFDVAFTPAAFAIDGRSTAMANVHDLHTAIGLIRAWATPDAHAGYVMALVAGELYRVELNQPLVAEVTGTPALRVDCRIVPPGKAAPFTRRRPITRRCASRSPPRAGASRPSSSNEPRRASNTCCARATRVKTRGAQVRGSR